jgi:hypothetical protein
MTIHRSATEAPENIVRRFAFQWPIFLHHHTEPFELIVSDHSVYVLRKRRFAIANPWYFETIPRVDIREVRVQRRSPVGAWLLGAAMVLVGGYTTFVQLSERFALGWWQGLTASVHESHWPVLVLFGGFLMPLAARSRYTLSLRGVRTLYRWNAPLVFEKKGRQQLDILAADMIATMRAAGIPTYDDR